MKKKKKTSPERPALFNPSATAVPCPRCLLLAREGRIRAETVQPVPDGVGIAPISRSGIRQCFDCASADTLLKLNMAPSFSAARIAVGNDRQEQYRLPGIQMGLVKAGLVRVSQPGDFERHLAWLDKQNWFDLKNPEE